MRKYGCNVCDFPIALSINLKNMVKKTQLQNSVIFNGVLSGKKFKNSFYPGTIGYS